MGPIGIFGGSETNRLHCSTVFVVFSKRRVKVIKVFRIRRMRNKILGKADLDDEHQKRCLPAYARSVIKHRIEDCLFACGFEYFGSLPVAQPFSFPQFPMFIEQIFLTSLHYLLWFIL